MLNTSHILIQTKKKTDESRTKNNLTKIQLCWTKDTYEKFFSFNKKSPVRRPGILCILLREYSIVF